jgi:hypothetical protein
MLGLGHGRGQIRHVGREFTSHVATNVDWDGRAMSGIKGAGVYVEYANPDRCFGLYSLDSADPE